jgi:solute carrier family 44 (choline transporter-like protein), member 2/4/5
MLEACSQFAIASIVAAWYWTPRYERSSLSGWKSLKRALLFTFVYHFGSLAFGSFILAILYLIRFLLDRLSKELKAAEQRGTNEYVKYMSKVFHIVFGFIEYLVRYLNGKVYIEIALNGHSFMGAISRVAHIITSNPVR